MEWIALLILWIGINAVIGYAIGKSKNDIKDSVLISILLGPIGWLIALIASTAIQNLSFSAG